jgi:hypothetical protein
VQRLAQASDERQRFHDALRKVLSEELGEERRAELYMKAAELAQ